MRSLLFLCAFVILSAPLSADIILSNGQTNTANTTVNDAIGVFNQSPGTPTTLVVESGANILGVDDRSISVFQTSRVQINGGSVQEDVLAFDRALVEISGGQLNDDVIADNRASVSILGGTIADDVEGFGRSTITIAGGSFGEDIEAFGRSTIVVSGGDLFQSGDPEAGFFAARNANIVLEARSVTVNGNNVVGEISDLSGTISGVLADGSSFSGLFDRVGGGSGSFNVVAVPEPSVFIALLLACVLLYCYRQRKLAPIV